MRRGYTAKHDGLIALRNTSIHWEWWIKAYGEYRDVGIHWNWNKCLDCFKTWCIKNVFAFFFWLKVMVFMGGIWILDEFSLEIQFLYKANNGDYWLSENENSNFFTHVKNVYKLYKHRMIFTIKNIISQVRKELARNKNSF